jgi:hypothetical protein
VLELSIQIPALLDLIICMYTSTGGGQVLTAVREEE